MTCYSIYAMMIKKSYNYIYWNNISKDYNLVQQYAELYKHKLNWKLISLFHRLDEKFIINFQDYIVWNYINLYNYHFSEPFIVLFQDKLDWTWIGSRQQLSIPFIRHFKDKLNWDVVSQYQLLNEACINEFADKVNWDYIFLYQWLSKKFKHKHKAKLHLDI